MTPQLQMSHDLSYLFLQNSPPKMAAAGLKVPDTRTPLTQKLKWLCTRHVLFAAQSSITSQPCAVRIHSRFLFARLERCLSPGSPGAPALENLRRHIVRSSGLYMSQKYNGTKRFIESALRRGLRHTFGQDILQAVMSRKQLVEASLHVTHAILCCNFVINSSQCSGFPCSIPDPSLVAGSLRGHVDALFESFGQAEVDNLQHVLVNGTCQQ